MFSLAEKESMDGTNHTASTINQIEITSAPFQISASTIKQNLTIMPLIENISEQNEQYRLPENIRPYHYNIELMPNIYSNDEKLFKASGMVKIYFRIYENPTSILILHSFVTIFDDTIILREESPEEGPPFNITNTSFKDKTQTYYIYLNESLQLDKNYSIEIQYFAAISTGPFGLMWSKYSYPKSSQEENIPVNPKYCFSFTTFKSWSNIVIIHKSLSTLHISEIIGT